MKTFSYIANKEGEWNKLIKQVAIDFETRLNPKALAPSFTSLSIRDIGDLCLHYLIGLLILGLPTALIYGLYALYRWVKPISSTASTSAEYSWLLPGLIIAALVILLARYLPTMLDEFAPQFASMILSLIYQTRKSSFRNRLVLFAFLYGYFLLMVKFPIIGVLSMALFIAPVLVAIDRYNEIMCLKALEWAKQEAMRRGKSYLEFFSKTLMNSGYENLSLAVLQKCIEPLANDVGKSKVN